MFSREVVTGKQMMQAILVGIGVGLVGVGCFVLLLVTANKTVDAPASETAKVAVDAPAQANAMFYAVQHGAFTTEASAQDFLAAYPTLNKALVIQVKETFYVWSALADHKRELTGQPPAFMKALKVVSAGCKQAPATVLPDLLKDEKALKLNFEEAELSKLPAQWTSVMSGLTALSKDVEVLRLHSLAHFLTEESCVQVSFDL